MNKSVIVYKVERYMCYSIRHIPILAFESYPLFSPDLVSTGFVALQQATNGAFLSFETNHTIVFKMKMT